jgi:ribosomal protein L9
MKIILLKDVPRIGQKNQILDLPNNYAMNSFVNKGLAKIATAAEIKKIEEQNKNKLLAKELETDKSMAIFLKLEKQDVADLIFSIEKISINPKQIDMLDIKTLGEYVCTVTANNKKYNLNLKVVKE